MRSVSFYTFLSVHRMVVLISLAIPPLKPNKKKANMFDFIVWFLKCSCSLTIVHIFISFVLPVSHFSIPCFAWRDNSVRQYDN